MVIPDSIFEDSLMIDHERESVKSLMHEFSDIFCEGNKDAICQNYIANIPLKEGQEEFVYTPSRNIPIHYRERAKIIIDQWIKDNRSHYFRLGKC